MRILQIGTFPYPSPQGSQVYVKGIIHGLLDLGHEVELLCYGHGQGTVVERPGFRVHRTPNILGYQNMRAGPDLMKPILDLLMALKMRGLKPDVIHVHNYEAPLVSLLAKFFDRALRGVPIVYSAHNLMGQELETYFESRRMRRISSAFGNFLDNTVPRTASHAVVLNERAVVTLQRLGCRNVSVVNPSVDSKEFLSLSELKEHCPLELERGQWVVYAGNPDAYQNLEILISAMNALPTVGLVIVSASDTRHIQRQNGNVLHMQTSDFQQVQAVIANADLAVIPRMECTGFPVKLLNYLMLECVTLVSEGSMVNLPGAVPFQNGNVEELVSKISYWLVNEKERTELGRLARTGVLKDCSSMSQARKLVKIYHSVLKTSDLSAVSV